MRYSSEHKAGTRNRIVQNASHALRRRGLNGIGIVGLMKTAGLTRGGFYSHFKSREALVAEAVACAMGQTASLARSCDDVGLSTSMLEAGKRVVRSVVGRPVGTRKNQPIRTAARKMRAASNEKGAVLDE